MATLKISIVDAETGRTREERYSSSPVRIGRNPRNELCLSFGFVSGWHAKIDFDEAGATFTDLGSTNGSTLGGRRLEANQAIALSEGLSVAIGKLELRVAWDAPDAPLPSQSGGDEQIGAPITRAPRSTTMPIKAVGEGPSGPAEPIRPERPSGAEATGFVDLGGVHRAIRELRADYQEFEAARARFQQRIEAELAQIPTTTRDTALAFLRREFPNMPGATPFAAPTAAAASSTETSAVGQLATALLHAVAPPANPDEQSAFLARVAELLQTAAQAFVEIRNVQARFGEEMGVRTIREYTPLHAAGDARGVLDYLLDWRRGGPERNAQLAAVYSDFMLHQVALINGVVDGVEALIEQFRPAEVERGVSGLNKAAGAWKKYTERYAEVIEERGVAALVFGPEFARAYARVGSHED